MYIGLHVKYPLFLSDLMKLEFSRQIFEEFPNIKFHDNPSNETRVVPSGRTNGRDVTKLTVAFCNFGNTPKMTEPYIFV
jgi:hypothetical protein